MDNNEQKNKEQIQQEKIDRNLKKAWEIINRNKEKKAKENKEEER